MRPFEVAELRPSPAARRARAAARWRGLGLVAAVLVLLWLIGWLACC